MLSRGAQGPEVEAVQRALTRAGFATPVDGDFGPATERSVREFQAARNLTVDGLVGPQTLRALGLDRSGKKRAGKKRAGKKRDGKKRDGEKAAPKRGARAAARAAYRAGFRGDDLATITMIAGRESGWRSDSANPNTSDRGMWQINWNNLQREQYDDLRAELGIEKDTDLLDLHTNAAVAFRMYEDSVSFGEPWFPWRGSDKGYDGKGPGWDPEGSHRWRTRQFAAKAKSAAAAVLARREGSDGEQRRRRRRRRRSPADGGSRSTYTIRAADADGFIAVVGRCVGITDAPAALRGSAAEAVAEHNGVALDHVWRPGDEVRFPRKIDGVRSYTVERGDRVAAVADGLGLGRGEAARERVAAINDWQGRPPRPGDTWYGGAA
jgi:hypothetical protein